MSEMLRVDGSQGEGGGQVLRTCLTLSAITGRPFHLTRIRAGRKKPGLRPQHLTGVRAAAAICEAEVKGDELNSTDLIFRPREAPRAGTYRFDVADAAPGGSAGSVTLIVQAILWPLLFAEGSSQVLLRGGTHVPFSPPFHYLAEVARPAFARLGARFELDLVTWGWMPRGQGEVTLSVQPLERLQAARFEPQSFDAVNGVAGVTNLPSHIPQRMASRANNLLAEQGLTGRIVAARGRGPAPGAGIVLWLPQAGFSALGRPGLPAEKVAEAAVAELRAFLQNRAAVDPHLADQLLLPMALAAGTSRLTTSRLTLHTLTNAQLLQQWLPVTLQIEGKRDRPGAVTVTGVGWSRPT